MMSPNRLSVTMTSNCFGLRTSCMAQLSAYMWLSATSGYASSRSFCTSSRHRMPDSMTFDFSAEHTLRPRSLARSNATAATRRISAVV